jgi:hypothetical protein
MTRSSVQLHPKREAKQNLKCPKVVNKDMAKLVKLAWEAGAHCESSGKNYVKIWPVDGSRMIRIPSTPSSPSQTFRNKLRALQRAGIGNR